MDLKDIKNEKGEFPTSNADLLHYKLEFSPRYIRSNTEAIEDFCAETVIKLENNVFSAKLGTDVKTENTKQDNDSTTDNNGLDTYPPDSYHFLLQKENDLCKYVTEVKEEKPFFFRDSLQMKTEDDLNLSSKNITNFTYLKEHS